MKTFKNARNHTCRLPGLACFSAAQKWQSLKHPPTFQTDTALLLTDGQGDGARIQQPELVGADS